MHALSFNRLMRYRYIELIALWEGRLTTKHLCQTFQIGRQQASKDINAYNKLIAPNNLLYDRSLKGYVPAANFAPKVTAGVLEEYLALATDYYDPLNILNSLKIQNCPLEDIRWPVRNVDPALIRSLVEAIKSTQRMEVDYVSVQQPDREGRIIAPHAMVFTGERWHMRAWCEKNRDYRDFVLSRFRGTPELLGPSKNLVEDDLAWQTKVAMEILPNPDLTLAQQSVVAEDYGMLKGKMNITIRAQLIPYALNLLRITINPEAENPLSNQLVLGNTKTLDKWLAFANQD